MAAVLVAPNTRRTPFREVYDRLLARHVKSGPVLGHHAGKLCHVLYGLLKSGTLYNEDRQRRALGLSNSGEPTVATMEAPEELVEQLDDERDFVAELDLEHIPADNPLGSVFSGGVMLT
jgi:hypothetical protein